MLCETAQRLHAFDREQCAGQAGPVVLCGVDEAGRGPLCGPVSIGAVILDAQRPIDGLNDSKKLSEKKREALYDEITGTALAWHVELVPPKVIDEMNILAATLWGMQQAVARLVPAPTLVLVDGNRAPAFACRYVAVTRGDSQSACIAAASVLAKVTRDRFMARLHEEYPHYQLARHKGYPTREHYALLRQYGPQPFYRQSFLKTYYAGKHGGRQS